MAAKTVGYEVEYTEPNAGGRAIQPFMNRRGAVDFAYQALLDGDDPVVFELRRDSLGRQRRHRMEHKWNSSAIAEDLKKRGDSLAAWRRRREARRAHHRHIVPLAKNPLALPEELKPVIGTLAHNRAFTIAEVSEYARFERPYVAQHASALVQKLVRDGYLERVERGRYYPTPAGWRWLEGRENPIPIEGKVAIVAGGAALLGAILYFAWPKSAPASPAVPVGGDATCPGGWAPTAFTSVVTPGHYRIEIDVTQDLITKYGSGSAPKTYADFQALVQKVLAKFPAVQLEGLWIDAFQLSGATYGPYSYDGSSVPADWPGAPTGTVAIRGELVTPYQAPPSAVPTLPFVNIRTWVCTSGPTPAAVPAPGIVPSTPGPGGPQGPGTPGGVQLNQ